MLFSIAAAAALVGSASAHAVMSDPKPYAPAGNLVQVDPLNGKKFLFPCQIGDGDYGAETDGTAVTAGQTSTVKFTGSAVHGGGSCQFSVTYEFPPPADPSKWKVLHSVIGGCPSAFNGNIPTVGQDADGREDGKQCGNDSCMDGVRQFDIPFPEEMPNGKATFAWTWFNKIGNREMYMNCAPITVSGGQDNSDYMDTLPELFVANYPGYCTSGQEGVLGFPNPGESVKVYEEMNPASSGECPAPGQGGYGGGSPSPPQHESPVEDAPAPVESQPASFHPAPEAPAPAPAPQPQQPDYQPPSHEAPATPSFATVVAPSPTEAPHVPDYAPPSTGYAPSADAIRCEPNGAVVCMDSGHFGMCNWGYAIPQAVAAGTLCHEGTIMKRSDFSRHARRHMLHAARHS